ncbi:TetR/AcrR family transcriptional regulator [Cohnella sp. WQ 127256]|uniref:TetR/AcrR family transcriptional regulator n=1 Tax=Cohnella sp. WQ 127256 TaxID=2938790 RepID=UPI0021185BFA|nr:TetR/AcrR family transcriptional regulator [Cohnella sp. WQ 127256]
MKNRIVQAAIQEITLRGLRFSIRDLAHRLGISTKTLYQHFPAKEQIVSYIVEQSIRQMKDQEQELMSNIALPVKQKLFDALVMLPQGFAFSDIRLLKELQNAYPDQWVIVDGYINQGWDNIRLLIQEGITSGDFRPFDIEIFISVYIGALYQLMDHGIAGHNCVSLEKALSQMVDFLLRGIYQTQASGME